MKYYITGDIHGDVSYIEMFAANKKAEDTTLAILGDCAFNYFLDVRDTDVKEQANCLGITLFCIKGNHELHPDQIKSYKQKEWNGAPVYYEEEYPNILFAKDGEMYTIEGRKVFVLGGAYSVDKYYRIMMGWKWFNTEQPSQETKDYAISTLEKNGWKADIVLTHTAPLKTQPTHLFIEGLDQSTVDNTTEKFLDDISDRLDFTKWYFGHYHADWENGKYEMLFHSVKPLFEA